MSDDIPDDNATDKELADAEHNAWSWVDYWGEVLETIREMQDERAKAKAAAPVITPEMRARYEAIMAKRKAEADPSAS